MTAFAFGAVLDREAIRLPRIGHPGRHFGWLAIENFSEKLGGGTYNPNSSARVIGGR